MAEAGTLKPDFRALKCRNRVFFLGIPFCTLQRYQKSKNPVGRIDTLSLPCSKQSSIDEGLLGTALLFSAVRCDFYSQCYLINRALQNLSSPRLIPSSLVNSDSCRYKLDLTKFIAFVAR